MIDQTIEQRYADKDYVFKDLCMVRKLFNTKTTEPEAKAGYKCLQMIRLYCPEECEVAVDATIYEFEYRMAVMDLDYHMTQTEGVEE